MKKSIVVLAVSSLFAASLAMAAPAPAADEATMQQAPAVSSAPANNSLEMAANNPAQQPMDQSSSNSNDDMSADTATGNSEDDY